MVQRKRLLACLLVCFCLTLQGITAHAQNYDLDVEQILTPADMSIVQAGFPVNITVEITNQGPGVCPFSIIEVVVKNGLGDPVFGPESHLLGSIAPFQTVVLNAGNWTPNELGNMTVSALNTVADLNPLNDETTADVTVNETIISQAQAITDVTDYMLMNSPYFAEQVAFLYKKDELDVVQPVGTTIGDFEATFESTLDAKTYVFWTDNEPGDEWMHASTFVFYNAWTGAITTQDAESWPVINGAEYLNFTVNGNSSTELVYGTYIEHPSDDVTYAAQEQPSTTVWALVITGKNCNGGGERTSRGNDLERVKNYLNSNPRGPQVPDENIKVESGTNLSGATKQDVCDALDELQDCAKLYVFYLGHGSKEGEAVLAGGNMAWSELAEKLIANGADEVCACIEACYSGTAIPAFQNARVDGEQLKGEIVTSSSSTKKTKRIDPCGTPFYKGLESCTADLSGDRDGDGKISVREATIWAAENDVCVSARDPQWGSIDDTEIITFDRKLSPRDLGKKDGIKFTYCITCYKKETTVPKEGGGTEVVKEDIWDTRFYALSKGINRTPEKTVSVSCNGEQVGTFSGTATANKKVCFATADGKCDKKVKVQYVDDGTVKGGDDRVQLSFDDGFRLAEYRTRTYNPGEHIFHSFTIEAATGNIITATSNQLSGWGIKLSHLTMSAAGLINPVELYVTGDVPTTATYGGRIYGEIRDTTEDDTSDIYIDAFVRRTKYNDLDDGQQASFNEIELFGGINAYTGVVDMTESTIHLRTSTNCTIATNGTLKAFNTSIGASLGTNARMVVNGTLNWSASSLVRPLNGMELNSPSGYMAGGGIHDSQGDGLRLKGNFAGFTFEGVQISGALNDGLAADGATNLVVEGADIVNSTGNDVTLINTSIVSMLNSYYNSSKESVEVGSTLLRNWTTSFIVLNQDGAALTNASVNVIDAYGTTVAMLTVDANGNTPNIDLTEYGRIGNSFYNFTPHSIEVSYNTTSHVQAYSAQDLHTETIVLTTPVVITDAPDAGPRAALSPDVEVFPNPAGARVNLRLNLPQAGEGRCIVFDASGRIIDAQPAQHLPAGLNTLMLNTSRWSNGSYYCLIQIGETEALARINVLR